MQYFTKEVEQNFWKSFLVNKRKRFNTISDTKSKTVLLKYKLYCKNKAKIWVCCCCKVWTLLSFDLLILYNELVMLSFPSFPFIALFLQVFCSKFAILFKFFSKKTNHFSTKPSSLFLSLVSLSSCTLCFHVPPNLSIAVFFRFPVSDCLFRVSASVVVHSLSSNLSVRSVRRCYVWLLVLLLTCIFSRSSKTSRRYCEFFAVV